MDDAIVLGQVCDTWQATTGQFALLEPLYLLNEETSGWVAVKDAQSKFPNRGCVTWAKAPEEAAYGTVWTFTYESHPTFDPHNLRQDQYRVNWDSPPASLVEVLDLQASDADDALRMLELGLRLHFVPTHSIYVALGDHTWAGPVRLVQARDAWFLDHHQRNLPVPRVRALPEHDLDRINIDGMRTFIRPGAGALVRVGELDWSPDKLVLQRLLHELRGRADIDDTLRLTKAAVQAIISALPGAERAVLPQKVARARAYLAEVELTEADLESFEAELLALPAIAERIAVAERDGRNAAKTQAEEQAAAQARRDLEALRAEQQALTRSLAEQRAQLAAVERAAEDAERRAREAADAEAQRRVAELNDLDAEIAARRRALEDQVALAEETIGSRLGELLARPSEALAHVALVRAALGGQPLARPGGLASGRQLSPPSAALRSGESSVDDQQRLVSTLRKEAAGAGVPPSTLVAVHSAFTAGMVPLLTASGGADALALYARFVAGGRVVTVNVVPTTLEPADLLGRLDPRTRSVAAHPSRLLDLLIFAQQRSQQDRLFLAVLEGVNRAAADAYLLPLIACYQTAWSGDEELPLSLVHPADIAPDDPYSHASHLVWPGNVLLAGTLSDGAATLPLPPSLWASAILIEADAGAEAGGAGGSSHRTSVAPCCWSEWRTRALADTSAGLGVVREIASAGDVRIPAPVARGFARTYTAARAWLPNEEKLLRMAAHCVLAPYAAATDQVTELAQALGVCKVPFDPAYLNALQETLA